MMAKISSRMSEFFRPSFAHSHSGKIRKNVLYFLNLTKLHIYEQLLLEESLYRLSSYLCDSLNKVGFVVINDTCGGVLVGGHGAKWEEKERSNDAASNRCVVMGISGKVKDYVKDVNYVEENNILLIRRYTGGGTVYINNNCVLLSLILPHTFEKEKKIYPSNITEWAFNTIYKPLANEGGKKKDDLFNENFYYHENDYVCKIYDEKNEKIILKKVGGNAQAFSKNYFVHHTSFIWFCNFDEMNNVIVNPSKQPVYRKKRSHNDFLTSVKSCLHKNIDNTNMFIYNITSKLRSIINEKNSAQKEEHWLFQNVQLNTNKNFVHLPEQDLFDHVYRIDESFLKEIFLLYKNNRYIKNLRSTHFVNIHGEAVSDDYYQFPSILS
ncbi:lipoate-protein ligase 2, putative [Plasmodium ovale]|uniref:Lipoate-protein ligase 2, putative n=2 Tax=Plasmodium ovale TaxID=36330 RepID=A0A1D3U7Z1_PLAOA|nr:lipoate-protein ligase 2, putative (LipL2) [Plasmodium ovale curtisi]SBS90958.1 lipoate-protein ligase 2, putative (LipL2) [Plasmodium ovale curtisi]SCQ16223.1 lipoate-protein ligase 2, putative [Plasmodium ovale]